MYSIAKQIDKEMIEWRKGIIKEMTPNEVVEFITSNDYEELHKLKYEQLMKDFERIANIEIDLRERYKKVVEARGYENQDRLLKTTNNNQHNNKGKVIKPYLITISPKENIIQNSTDLIEFNEKIQKYCNRKMLNKDELLTYSIEQRKGPDDPELGKGVHSHIIAFSDLPKSELVKNTISSFNKICEPQGIDIRPINNIEIAKKYISGENKGGKTPEEIEKKKLHCLGDIKWRELNNIKPIYTYPFETPTGGDETSPISSPPNITPSNIILEFT